MANVVDPAVRVSPEISVPPQTRVNLLPFSSFSLGFWRSKSATDAWFLTVTLLTLVVADVGVQVAVNRWNALFFNALEKKEGNALLHYVGLFFGIVTIGVIIAVSINWMRVNLQISWRRWLTSHMIAHWLNDRRYYQLNLIDGNHDNPESRLVDDVRLATEPLVDFLIGLTRSVLQVITFIGILWIIGGSLTIPWNGTTFAIPGYLVIAVLIYSIVMSGATLLIGQNTILAVQQKNAVEAQLRCSLARIRENAESIALMNGEEEENISLVATLRELVRRGRDVVRNQAKIGFVSGGNAYLAPVIPLILAWPNYIAGHMSLGQLMQAAAAFGSVQWAMNWLVENFIRFAEWRASANRVRELMSAIKGLENEFKPDVSNKIEIGPSPNENIHLVNLFVSHSTGQVLIHDAEVIIEPSEKVLIEGESGTGKSTLIRAVAGLWPWGTGKILLPISAQVMFIPQRAYIPLGTLRETICYPFDTAQFQDSDIENALRRCGIKHLTPRLDDDKEHWAKILSGGEQQRLAFTRCIIQRPDIIIMDEATSALDEASQDSLMNLFNEELADTTVISVGHRPSLAEYHSRRLQLKKEFKGTQIIENKQNTKLKLLRFWPAGKKAA